MSFTRARLAKIIQLLRGWLSAYPLAMFPEPDLAMAAGLLKAGGMTLDSISASNMRHVANQIAPKALALLAALKAQRKALEGIRRMAESTGPGDARSGLRAIAVSARAALSSTQGGDDAQQL